MALSTQSWIAIGTSAAVLGGFALGGWLRRRRQTEQLVESFREFRPSMAQARLEALPELDMSLRVIRAGTLAMTTMEPAVPSADYVMSLVDAATSPLNAKRTAIRASALSFGDAGELAAMWTELWRAMADGFGSGFNANLGRLPEADDIITNLMAYESVWRDVPIEDKIANLISRHAWLLSGAPKYLGAVVIEIPPARKYGARLWTLIGESGCRAESLPGKGQHVLPTGQIRSGRITLVGCDQETVLKLLVEEVSYVAFKVSVLREKGKLKSFDVATLFRRIAAVVATVAAGFVTGGVGAAVGAGATIALETAEAEGVI